MPAKVDCDLALIKLTTYGALDASFDGGVDGISIARQHVRDIIAAVYQAQWLRRSAAHARPRAGGAIS